MNTCTRQNKRPKNKTVSHVHGIIAGPLRGNPVPDKLVSAKEVVAAHTCKRLTST